MSEDEQNSRKRAKLAHEEENDDEEESLTDSSDNGESSDSDKVNSLSSCTSPSSCSSDRHLQHQQHLRPPPSHSKDDDELDNVSAAFLLAQQRQAEIRALVREARHFGFKEWLLRNSHLSWSERFEVFDVVIQPDALTEDELHKHLRDALIAKTGRRERLEHINSVDHVVELLKTSQNIIVLTGAGVSVSCGIPDFRSRGGIYSRLEEFELDDPQQMFDIDYFRYCPQTFYSFAKEIYPSNFKPSPSHMFIKLLETRQILLRNYTQNIDTLEQVAGINRIIQCHGSFATASCITCGLQMDGKKIEAEVMAKEIPYCKKCKDSDHGIIKPDIVFFGEKLPDVFKDSFLEDREKVDLLIVIGSSLKVSPVADVIDMLPHNVPQVLINLESLPHANRFDVQLLGHCDEIVQELCRRLSWDLNISLGAHTTTEIERVDDNKYLFKSADRPQPPSSSTFSS